MNERNLLFRLFNKLQESKTITLNEELHNYLMDLIRKRFQELKQDENKR